MASGSGDTVTRIQQVPTPAGIRVRRTQAIRPPAAAAAPSIVGNEPSSKDKYLCFVTSINAVSTDHQFHPGAIERLVSTLHPDVKGREKTSLMLRYDKGCVDGFFEEGRILLRRDENDFATMLKAREMVLARWPERETYFLYDEYMHDALRGQGLLHLIEPPVLSKEEREKHLNSRMNPIGDTEVSYYYSFRQGKRYLTADALEEILALPAESHTSAMASIDQFAAPDTRHPRRQLALFNTSYSLEEFDAVRAQQGSPTERLLKILSFMRNKQRNQYLVAGTENYQDQLLEEMLNERYHEVELLKITPELKHIHWQPGGYIIDGRLQFHANAEEHVRGIIERYWDSHKDVLSAINLGKISGRGSVRPAWAPRRELYLVEKELRIGDEDEVLCDVVRRLEYDTGDYLNIKQPRDGGLRWLDVEEAERAGEEHANYKARMREYGSTLIGQQDDHEDFSFFEVYGGMREEFRGRPITAHYIARPYVAGIATDKLPLKLLEEEEFRDAAFYMFGRILADSLVLKRKDPKNRTLGFDGDETLLLDEKQRPISYRVTDYSGVGEDLTPGYGIIAKECLAKLVKQLVTPQRDYLGPKRQLLITSAVDHFGDLQQRNEYVEADINHIFTARPDEDVHLHQRHRDSNDENCPYARAMRCVKLLRETNKDNINKLLRSILYC